ncbi:RING-H2 finger protein ATL79-like [Magnolia sinica]|uniref:RING-H2 finger protein ATL79-like n=1 Tax=Magnolia sinica TaxID=86752 RepID=UPI002657DBD1|nr:RING-H2 finger protein ATL79-like [Magnolia sinica]
MPSSSSSPTLLSPPLSRDPTSGGTWFPYHSAGDFEANLVMILIILICALVCALALNAAIRCFLRRRRPQPEPTTAGKLTHTSTEMPALPTLVFSAGMKMAGAEAECAICLSEFENGEGIRVLPRCKHGFHEKCIEGWLASRSSCPTCRSSCLLASPEKNTSGGGDVEAPPEVVERLPEV